MIYEAADPLFPAARSDRGAPAIVQALFDLPEEFILFVSTIEPRKNVAGLLRAYRRLRDNYKLTPALVLAGAPGWLSEDVLALVEELNLSRIASFSAVSHPRPALPVQRRTLPGASGLLRGLWPDAAGGDGLRYARRSCPTSPACRRWWAMPRC